MKYSKIEINGLTVGAALIVNGNGDIALSGYDLSEISGGPGLSTLEEANDTTISGEVSGEVLRYNGTEWVNGFALEDEIYVVCDRRTTDSGIFTASAWRTRDLSYELSSTTWGSISSNQITIADEGVYLVEAQAPAYEVRSHQARFKKISGGGTDEVRGSCQFDYAANLRGCSNSLICATIEVSSAPAVYELQHYCSTTSATVNGFGIVHGSWGDDIISWVSLTKVGKV